MMMEERKKPGRKKRKYRTKAIQFLMPLGVKNKMMQAAQAYDLNQTEYLAMLTDIAYEEYQQNQELNLTVGEINQAQNDFVDHYIDAHYGSNPKNIIEARSEALKAYYKAQGFEFGPEEDAFILPDSE